MQSFSPVCRIHHDDLFGHWRIKENPTLIVPWPNKSGRSAMKKNLDFISESLALVFPLGLLITSSFFVVNWLLGSYSQNLSGLLPYWWRSRADKTNWCFLYAFFVCTLTSSSELLSLLLWSNKCPDMWEEKDIQKFTLHKPWMSQKWDAQCLKITQNLKFLFLAFSTNFCPTCPDLSGNTVWPQASGF